MIRSKLAAVPRIAAIAGALALIGAPALAETASQRTTPHHATTKKNSKPVARPNRNAADSKSGYWSVNYSIPDRYSAQRDRPARTSNVTLETTSEFGRVPTQTGTGTIGFTTDNAVKRGELYDGRAVPGVNQNTQAESSFVGLSLSVTSADKSFPVPLPTPWSRPE